MDTSNEPDVINDDLIRTCAQLEGPPENLEEKRRQTDYDEIERLSFSFKNIQKIENLRALDSLTKLQLDNNQIKKIEKIDHLVNLTWLDLSFNRISKIEGLDKLTKIRDLSLHNNQIKVIENLDKLTELNVFSIGQNLIENMENTMYLRKFHNLRLVNLAGNPFTKDPEYFSYVLSHINNLKYLDYRLVDKNSVITARDVYQDELLELEQKEELITQERKKAKEDASHAELMAEANMTGVETMFDDMMKLDPELGKMRTVKGLADQAINDFKIKYEEETEKIKEEMLIQHDRKKDERDMWQATVDKACNMKDEEGRLIITLFQTKKKHAFEEVRDNPSKAEQILTGPMKENLEMRDQLMELEMQSVEVIDKLIQEFERSFAELVDATKGVLNSYFGVIRDLENMYFENVGASATSLLDDYSQGKMDPDDLAEEARTLLSDKDTLMNAVQASHDAHTSKIDSLEDLLINNETNRFNGMLAQDKVWEHKRNRDRIDEIYNLIERNKGDMEEILSQDDQND
mmetsp:Transcript_16460/g.27686  ORF Transcript_16460/g.27686 Transcript_16460/m.27686 type:complete len:518 (+) Transcript_16460:341-1894(+)|eukprot:CAMPEP_0198213382 /NCGR_PEP_ID=MMETSP1445-20131203/28832_1 /TAXON_ID=36898 /ORGANISM="Pyramimonas sp., Strain CCMP2087" /LENGTH=517 /DNA_ID=CAMNT_0043888015 /DNA_START=337 /DNA_END=1890 /DNA_ORIENTATION=-